MHQYLNLLKFASTHGFYKGDRTKTGTKSIAGLVARYDLRGKKIAAVTTKKHAFKPGLVEEQWMLSGDTNVDFLKEHGCNIWDEWVFPNTATYRTRSVKEMQRQYTRDHHGWGKPKLMPTWLEPGTIVEPHYQGDSFDIVIAELNGMQSHMVIDKSARAANKSNWYNPEDPIWIEFYSAMGISDQEVVTGSLGSVYGKTFRDLEDTRIIKNIKAEEHIDMCKRGFTFEGTLAGERAVYTRRIDQVAALLKELAKDPDSRRLIICPWTPALLDEQALPPCHSFIQFWTRELTADERYALYLVKSKEDQELINQQAAEHPEEPLFGTYTQMAVLHKDVFRSRHGDPKSPIDEVALHKHMDTLEIPKRALTCLMYQR